MLGGVQSTVLSTRVRVSARRRRSSTGSSGRSWTRDTDAAAAGTTTTRPSAISWPSSTRRSTSSSTCWPVASSATICSPSDLAPRSSTYRSPVQRRNHGRACVQNSGSRTPAQLSSVHLQRRNLYSTRVDVGKIDGTHFDEDVSTVISETTPGT